MFVGKGSFAQLREELRVFTVLRMFTTFIVLTRLQCWLDSCLICTLKTMKCEKIAILIEMSTLRIMPINVESRETDSEAV